MIGSLSKSLGRHLYILVATDYLLKWTEEKDNCKLHSDIYKKCWSCSSLENQLPSQRIVNQEWLSNKDNIYPCLEELEIFNGKWPEAHPCLEC